MVNRIGMKFGLLTVISEAGRAKNGGILYLCSCRCGKQTEVNWGNLNRGMKSCGCLPRPKRSHGKTETRAYGIWRNMRTRCENTNNSHYPLYGGRGILICPRWLKFEKFIEDMGNPEPGKSLDRIDVNGPYSKENCRWVSQKEQCRNKRNNRIVTWNGKTGPLTSICEDFGVDYKMISARLRLGWSLERSFGEKKYSRKLNEI